MPSTAERRAAIDVLLARVHHGRLTPGEAALLGKHVRAEQDHHDQAQQRAERAEREWKVACGRLDQAERERAEWKATATLRRERAETAEQQRDRFEAAWQNARQRAAQATRRAAYRLDRLSRRSTLIRELGQQLSDARNEVAQWRATYGPDALTTYREALARAEAAERKLSESETLGHKLLQRAERAEEDANRQRKYATKAAQRLHSAKERAEQAEGTLRTISNAHRWADVWSALGMHYGWKPEYAGQQARERRLDAEHERDLARRRAEEAEAAASRSERTAEDYRGALSHALRLGNGASWAAIHDRARGLATAEQRATNDDAELRRIRRDALARAEQAEKLGTIISNVAGALEQAGIRETSIVEGIRALAQRLAESEQLREAVRDRVHGECRRGDALTRQLAEAQERLARIRDMADAWERRLPATICTATAAEAVRNAAVGDDRPVMFSMTAPAVTVSPGVAVVRDREAERRAEQAEAVTAETKRLMERRTTTLRERAERAEDRALNWACRSDRYRAAWRSARRRARAAEAALTAELPAVQALDRVRTLAPQLEYDATAVGLAEPAREVFRDAARRIRDALTEPETVTTEITADTTGLAYALRAATPTGVEFAERLHQWAAEEHARPAATAADDDAHAICPHGVCDECNGGPCDVCQPVTLATECANPECEHPLNWHTGTPRGVCVERGGACPCEKFQPPTARR
jgi:hypothetical protein